MYFEYSGYDISVKSGEDKLRITFVADDEAISGIRAIIDKYDMGASNKILINRRTPMIIEDKKTYKCVFYINTERNKIDVLYELSSLNAEHISNREIANSTGPIDNWF